MRGVIFMQLLLLMLLLFSGEGDVTSSLDQWAPVLRELGGVQATQVVEQARHWAEVVQALQDLQTKSQSPSTERDVKEEPSQAQGVGLQPIQNVAPPQVLSALSSFFQQGA